PPPPPLFLNIIPDYAFFFLFCWGGLFFYYNASGTRLHDGNKGNNQLSVIITKSQQGSGRKTKLAFRTVNANEKQRFNGIGDGFKKKNCSQAGTAAEPVQAGSGRSAGPVTEH
ncbi:hypothetical protein, partial [Enterobacter intestinihominis]